MGILTVTNTENIVLNGKQQGSTQTIRFPNIVDVYSRTFKIHADTLTTLYTTVDAILLGGAVFDDSSVKYVRITNRGTEALVINIICETANKNSAYEIQSGQSYYLYSHTQSAFADDQGAITTAEMRASLEDIDTVKGYCAKANCRVELFIASTEPGV